MASSAEQLLVKHKLRITSFRLRLIQLFMNAPHAAVAQNTIEAELDDFDRITLYRTLKSFEKTGLIHKVVDGTRANKFALCHNDCEVHHSSEDHAHFLCNSCGETRCLDDMNDLPIRLPDNYVLSKVQIALSGICANCS